MRGSRISACCPGVPPPQAERVLHLQRSAWSRSTETMRTRPFVEPPASEPTGRGGLLLRKTPGKAHCEWHPSPVNRDGEPFIGVFPPLVYRSLFRQLVRGQAANRGVASSCLHHSTVCRSGSCKRGQMGSGDQPLTHLVMGRTPSLATLATAPLPMAAVEVVCVLSG